MVSFSSIKKKLWIAAGIFFLFIAVLAYIIPLIPTPPFIAASLYCFAKGSRRFHDWLLYRTTFGKYFLIYREKGTLPKKFKIVAISILIFGAVFSSVFVFDNWWLRGTLIFFVILTVVFLLRSKNTEE